jgi:hypothetical protein
MVVGLLRWRIAQLLLYIHFCEIKNNNNIVTIFLNSILCIVTQSIMKTLSDLLIVYTV